MHDEMIEYGLDCGYGDAFLKLAADVKISKPKTRTGGAYNVLEGDTVKGSRRGINTDWRGSTSYRIGKGRKVMPEVSDPSKQSPAYKQELGELMGAIRESRQAKDAARENAAARLQRNREYTESKALLGPKKQYGFGSRALTRLRAAKRAATNSTMAGLRAAGDHISTHKKYYIPGAIGAAALGAGAYAMYRRKKKKEQGVTKAAEFIYEYING